MSTFDPTPGIKPIRPEDIADHKLEVIPSYVIDVVNKLIAKEYCEGEATVSQDDIVTGILARSLTRNLKRQEIFDNGWLNFEEIYRKAGWEVEYDRSDYTETRSSKFIFRAK